MPEHRFAIGQSVRLRQKFGSPVGRGAEIYEVTGKLPARDNSPQYKIRSSEERHERVTTEDSLEQVEQPIGVGQ